MTKTTDAARRVSFRITPSDIRRATRKDPERCAAALALKRELGADKVEVHLSRTYIDIGGRRRRFVTPIALKQEIVTIDRGGRFAAGDYVLKPIPPSQTKRQLKITARNRPSARRPAKRNRKIPNVRGRAPK